MCARHLSFTPSFMFVTSSSHLISLLAFHFHYSRPYFSPFSLFSLSPLILLLLSYCSFVLSVDRKRRDIELKVRNTKLIYPFLRNSFLNLSFESSHYSHFLSWFDKKVLWLQNVTPKVRKQRSETPYLFETGRERGGAVRTSTYVRYL